MLSIKSLLPLALAAASAVSAEIVCSTTPITKGTLSVGTSVPSQTGPLLGEKADGTFETRGTNASTLIWTFPCTSSYLGISDDKQTEIPQAHYGLMIIADGPDTSPNPDSRCLAVAFDAGSQDAGNLVSQPCSFEDDESQTAQFFALWKTKKPEPYFQYERFQGYSHYNQPTNPYFYGSGYSVNYANKTGSPVRVEFSGDPSGLLTLVKPRH